MTSRKLSPVPVALFFVLVLSFALPGFAEGSSDDRVTAASCQRCGDGYCARSCENERTCPADCAPQTSALRCGKCGDGRCVPQCGETATSCPADCGVETSVAPAKDTAKQCEPAETESAAPKPDPKKE